MTGRATPGRRTVLASAAGVPLVVGAGGLAALAGLATGCSGGTPAAADTPRPTPPPVPGAALRTRAAADSTALLARYDGLIAARPELTARLAPLRAEVARHAQAFGAPAAKPAPRRDDRHHGPAQPRHPRRRRTPARGRPRDRAARRTARAGPAARLGGRRGGGARGSTDGEGLRR
ncbi:hypothetical protein [Streptomyces sp. SPB162]|uniref:hypothetical protein n=1 Tax=Streptomyces sp. SPB162 TaxID=2940560 RepID=UPI002A57F515|nr:hypothetical protein [Streptomyces sp. SPB162]